MDRAYPVTLEQEYLRLCSEPSDIFQHLPTFVDLVVELDAQHVIELGTRTGVSTIAWLYGLEQTGGRLTSVDLDERPDIGDHDHWRFIQGGDLDLTVIGELEPADIVFIDTSHTYRQTLAELNLYRWLTSPGGLMVLHDTELRIPMGAPMRPLYPVKTAIQEFCDEHNFEWSNHTNNNGLGIVRV
jgi:cephalosporin hydroxylase